jgi:NADH-quinone oxidoreductase subunit M
MGGVVMGDRAGPVGVVVLEPAGVVAGGMMTGPVTKATEQHIKSDLSWRERWALIPLVAAILVLGFWPKPALDEIAPTTASYMATAGVTDPVAQTEEGR